MELIIKYNNNNTSISWLRHRTCLELKLYNYFYSNRMICRKIDSIRKSCGLKSQHKALKQFFFIRLNARNNTKYSNLAINKAIRLPDHCSVFQAEICAIHESDWNKQAICQGPRDILMSLQGRLLLQNFNPYTTTMAYP